MADFKLKDPADSVTITATGLASLATSSTLVAGYALAAVSNRTNLDLAHLVSIALTVGTTPTSSTMIEVWAIAGQSVTAATVTWPDVFTTAYTGAAGAFTARSRGVLFGAGIPLKIFSVDSATSDRVYPAVQLSLAQANGGDMPTDWFLWVTHNTGVNFNATGGNFTASYWRRQMQSV